MSSKNTLNPPSREPGLHCRAALLPGGWARDVRVQHADGRITLIETATSPLPGDERANVLLPGVPNVHSHAFQRGMAGLTERRGGKGAVRGSADGVPRNNQRDDQRENVVDTFWSWRQLMYQFVARLTPEDLEAIAAQAFIEMLEAGFTRVGEFHYVHHDVSGNTFANPAEMGERIAAAAARTGIALTLLPVFYAHGGFGGAPASPQQVRFLNDVAAYGRLVEASRKAVESLDDAVVGIAPHSLRAVTPVQLREVLALAEVGAGRGAERGAGLTAGHVPVHIHVAEQLREVEECEASLGVRPVQLLLNEMAVDSRWCLVHATHVTDAEVTALARSGAVAGLCPITEANLGDGVFPAAAFQEQGGAFAVGSDSNVLISVSEELRLLEYTQRLRDRARNVMAGAQGQSTGRASFEAVVRAGAQALGARSGLEEGAPADIVSLSDDVSLAARQEDQILDTFVFASPRGLIDGVWRRGRKVVSGGVHVQRAPIAARLRATLQRLLA